jgi:hypothetical protein
MRAPGTRLKSVTYVYNTQTACRYQARGDCIWSGRVTVRRAVQQMPVLAFDAALSGVESTAQR